MGEHLKGRVAVVTGSGRGIGRGIAMLMASEGARVVINDLGVAVSGVGGSKAPADEVVDEIRSKGGEAVGNYDTVATMEGGEKIIRTALDKFGRVDILVHTAGILRDRMVFNMSEDEWDTVIAVHLKGMFATAKPASIAFRQQRSGRIIGFTSPSGLYGNPGQANYGAAKDGVAGFVRTVARDMGRYGVTVNGISPAADTRMTQTVTDQQRQLRARATGGMTVQRATNHPDDVAPFVVYLCTDHAKDINGQIFYVAGGAIGLMNNPYAAKTIQKFGRWTFEEIAQQLPATVGKDLVNPAPPVQPQAGAG